MRKKENKDIELNIMNQEIFNKIIKVYIGITIIAFQLYTIAPFIRFISGNFLYKFKTYLGLIGGILIIIDLISQKNILKGKYWKILFAFLIICLLSAFKMRKYGIKDNIFNLAWLTIQFTIFYSYIYSLKKCEINMMIKRIFSISLIINIFACLYSIIMFFTLSGYKFIADTRTDNPELVRQGFYNNRLFGIFTGIDYAVYFSFILILGCIYFYNKDTRKKNKIMYILSTIIMFIYIVLSGSRSILISMIIVVVILSNYFYFRNKEKKYRYSILRAMAISILSVILLILSIKSVRIASIEVVNSQLSNSNNKEIIKELTREELDDNYFDSNGRFAIWSDYISIYKDYGLLGLSISNYNDYISENHNDKYIVKYFEKLSEISGKTDLVYESHNNFIFILVSAGYLGFTIFMVFLLKIARDIIYQIFVKKKISIEIVILLSILIVLFIQSMFMNSIFMKINVMSFVFWFCLGILLNLLNHEKYNDKTKYRESVKNGYK